jgi:hypothetical protein
MKTLPIAAAALLLGSSAQAMIPSAQPAGPWAEEDAHMMSQSMAMGSSAAAQWADQADTLDWWNAARPAVSTSKAGPAVKSAAAGETVKAEAMARQAAIDDAMITAHEHAMAAELQLAGYDAAPADAVVQTAPAELTPRPAAQNYPACRPGPGDDNCIQLYEPGVEERLAAWQQPTGGFAGGSDARVAMGGPYEPLDDSAIETARADISGRAAADGNMALSAADTDDEDVAEI